VNQQDDARSVDTDEIRLTLPALPSYGRVARLAVTGLASRNGYSYDEVEDLRIAIGEAFGVLVSEERPGGRLVLTCLLLPDALEVTAARRPPEPIEQVTDLSRQILDAVVDRAEIDEPGGRIRVRKQLGSCP
jgi:anti-sigma regulatory factor (Ser/Thr protein kinase)